MMSDDGEFAMNFGVNLEIDMEVGDIKVEELEGLVVVTEQVETPLLSLVNADLPEGQIDPEEVSILKDLEIWVQDQDLDSGVVDKHSAAILDDGDEDAEEMGARATGTSAQRQSESKKELLKVVENKVNRLMVERNSLDKIYQELEEAETKVNAERKMYTEMLKYVDDIAPDTMTEQQWEDFFNEHFVGLVKPKTAPVENNTDMD